MPGAGAERMGSSAVRSGLLTGLSAVAVNAASAVAGALLARKFGHGAQTDGFFAAYAVYISLVLVANALRVVVLPEFARAHVAGSLGQEVGSWALALARAARARRSPSSSPRPHAVAGLLTGNEHRAGERRQAAAVADPGGGRAGVRGARGERPRGARRLRDRRLRVRARRGRGVVVIVVFIDHGVVAFGWGIAANGAVSLGVAARRAALAPRSSPGQERPSCTGCACSSRAWRCRSRCRGCT